MGFGHQQHAADEVRGGHTLGASALSGDRGGDWCDQSSQLTPCKGNQAPAVLCTGLLLLTALGSNGNRDQEGGDGHRPFIN